MLTVSHSTAFRSVASRAPPSCVAARLRSIRASAADAFNCKGCDCRGRHRDCARRAPLTRHSALLWVIPVCCESVPNSEKAAPDECERHVGTNDPAALVAAALANNYSIAGKYHMETHWGVQIAFLLEFPSTKWVTVAVAEPKHWPRVGLGGVGLRIDARTHAALVKVASTILHKCHERRVRR